MGINSAITYNKITLINIEGKCQSCYEKKAKKYLANLSASNSSYTFDVSSKTITLTFQAKNIEQFLKSLDVEYKQEEITGVPIGSLRQAVQKKSKQMQFKNSWLPWLKPTVALIIGYFELCCVLMAWSIPQMWLWVAGINLILIGLLGSDYFIAAKASMRYLAPMMLGLLLLLCLPVLLPIVVEQYLQLWMLSITLMFTMTVGMMWSIRDTLNMETLIVLAITMAWLFSTMQLIFPGLSAAFGLQLYYQDSMIILGVVGIAQHLKADWQQDTTVYRVYDGAMGAFVDKPYSQVMLGDIIHLSQHVTYPFTLKFNADQGELKVNAGTRDATGDKLRAVQANEHIQPWEIIHAEQDKFATVIEQPTQQKKMLKNWADQVAQYFIPLMLSIAALSGLLWFCFGPVAQAIPLAIKSFMGVLMATCPCVLGVVAPICETITRKKLAEQGCHLNKGNSIGHWQSIKQVVFDKTGTLTMYGQQDGQTVWPYREGCDEHLFKALHQQGKQGFILSGDGNSDRRKNLNAQFDLDNKHILCHEIFSAQNDENRYKHILLQWLAYEEAIEFPDELVKLEQAYHKLDKENIEAVSQNVDQMKHYLEKLAGLTRPKETYSLLYIDDGPGLEGQQINKHYLTLQAANSKHQKTSSCADGLIETPVLVPQIFPAMEEGLKYLNQQLLIAGIYNTIAIPVMAGALWFWCMPSPWMGAILMNLFSLFLIHRAQQIKHVLDLHPFKRQPIQPILAANIDTKNTSTSTTKYAAIKETSPGTSLELTGTL